jgi:ATP-dependent Lon protease
MLIGNIPLTNNNLPISKRYFDALPASFRKSALLDRFYCFIEGWKLPRMNKSMILKDWTIHVEYFSEILHSLRTEPEYATIVSETVIAEEKSDLRNFKAVQRLATAYLKLRFPHITMEKRSKRECFARFQIVTHLYFSFWQKLIF